MADFEKVAETTELQPGEGKVVQAGGREVALFNVEGKFCAIDNTCVHRGGPLGEGMLEGSIVTCPWHGWKYDVTTGKCATAPGREVSAYEVKVEGAAVLVKAGS
jgi:nitrite reductase/ring-hydroxylating ferredoxin subunit